jgi:hypothetical protein
MNDGDRQQMEFIYATYAGKYSITNWHTFKGSIVATVVWFLITKLTTGATPIAIWA